MEHALINIVKNAIESIDQKGTITFTTNAAPYQLVISDSGKALILWFLTNFLHHSLAPKRMGKVLD